MGDRRGGGGGRAGFLNGLGKLCSFAKRAGVKTMRSDLCSGLGRLPQCLLRNGDNNKNNILRSGEPFYAVLTQASFIYR